MGIAAQQSLKLSVLDQSPIRSGATAADAINETVQLAEAADRLGGAFAFAVWDGRQQAVVAHRDPGVPNWLDTSEHREGFLTPRWAYSETPQREDWPSITAQKVPFDEIRKHLPETTRSVSPEERREQVFTRARHVQKRFRVF